MGDLYASPDYHDYDDDDDDDDDDVEDDDDDVDEHLNEVIATLLLVFKLKCEKTDNEDHESKMKVICESIMKSVISYQDLR